MDSCVGLWLQDYERMSSVIFDDEQDVAPFEYISFADQYKIMRNHLGGYSLWALFVALVCSIFMLIPYFTTTPDFALRGGKKDGLFVKIKKMIDKNQRDDDSSSEELDYM